MIKSTKTTLKFCNHHRIVEISSLINEYKNVMKQFITLLWNQSKINRMADKTTCSQIKTWLSARMIQCAGKQASAIIICTRAKQEKRKYIIDKLIKSGDVKKAKQLQKIYDDTLISMPQLDDIEIELDARFI